MLSHSVVSDSVTPWTIASQVPMSMGILQARILEWVATPSPGDLPHPGMEPRPPTLQVDSLPFEPPGKSLEALIAAYCDYRLIDTLVLLN